MVLMVCFAGYAINFGCYISSDLDDPCSVIAYSVDLASEKCL